MPAIAPVLTGTSVTKRPDAVSLDYLTAFTFGPRDVGDSTAGPLNRPWKAFTSADKLVWIQRANDANDDWEPATLLFTYTGVEIAELDVAFEQAARPVITAERDGHVWIYWFNPSLGVFAFEELGVGRNVRCALDNPKDVTSSDVLIFYMNDEVGFLCYRAQRELYATEHQTPLGVTLDYYLEEVAFSTDNRMQIWYSMRNEVTGKYSKNQLQTTLYPIPVDEDKIQAAGQIESGEIDIVLIDHVLYDIDEISAAGTIIDGFLISPIIDHLLYDTDQIKAAGTILSGILSAPVINHILYDIDNFKAVGAIISGSLPIVVVFHSLFDVDQMQASGTILSGTLV